MPIFSFVTVDVGELLLFFGNLTSSPAKVQPWFLTSVSSSLDFPASPWRIESRELGVSEGAPAARSVREPERERDSCAHPPSP